MANVDLEKEIKEIRKDLDTLNKKIDLVIDKSKEKDSEKRAGLKDSYQLFFAVILGAIGAELLHPIFEPTFINQFPWIFGVYVFVIVTLLIILSIIGGYLPRWIANLKK